MKYELKDCEARIDRKKLIQYDYINKGLKTMVNNLVRCCNCDWMGADDELELVGVAVFGEEEEVVAHESRYNGAIKTLIPDVEVEEYIDACPNCLTDSYLTNLV